MKNLRIDIAQIWGISILRHRIDYDDDQPFSFSNNYLPDRVSRIIKVKIRL